MSEKQKVLDDAISRRAVLELVADYNLSMGQVVRGIHALPSVQPSRKVIEDIKAEIERVIDNTYDSTDYDKSLYNGAYKDGLYKALDIIEMHIADNETKAKQ